MIPAGKRYYYDDPIDALYMMKHFDVKLICYYTTEEESEYEQEPGSFYPFGDADLQQPDTIDDLLAELEDFRLAYIHPESMGIFDPKDGDIDESGRVFIAKQGRWEDYALRNGSTDRSCVSMLSSTAIRDNRPFIWPKEENDA